MKNRVIICFIFALLIGCELKDSRYDRHERIEINTVISLSGKSAYKDYFHTLIEEINNRNDNYIIIPTYTQTDTEAVLKLIYDKENEQKYDFVFIQPHYIEALIDQNLVKPLNHLIEQDVGLKILDEYISSALEYSIKDNKIWSLPIVRDTLVHISKSKGIEELILIEKIMQNEDEVDAPINRIIKDTILRQDDLLEVSSNQQLIDDISIINNRFEVGKVKNYSEQTIDIKEHFIKSGVKSMIINSLSLKHVNFDTSGFYSVNTIYINENTAYPLSGSYLFLVNNDRGIESLAVAFEGIITESLKAKSHYDIPLIEDKENRKNKYDYQNYSYENNTREIYKNISVIEARISTTVINIMQTDGDLSRLLEILNEQLAEIIE